MCLLQRLLRTQPSIRFSYSHHFSRLLWYILPLHCCWEKVRFHLQFIGLHTYVKQFCTAFHVFISFWLIYFHSKRLTFLTWYYIFMFLFICGQLIWVTSKWVLYTWVKINFQRHFDLKIFHKILGRKVFFEKKLFQVWRWGRWVTLFTHPFFQQTTWSHKVVCQSLRLIILIRI